MSNNVVSLGKRLLLLLPALVLAYLSTTSLLPLFNRRLPLLVALLITYIITAYVLIPASIRLYRIFFPAKHLPHYSTTSDGFAADPVNIALIGTKQQVIDCFKTAGWYRAVPLSPRTFIRSALSVIYKWSYPDGPVSTLYLFGRKQDLAFQLPLEDGAADTRHHVRFWAASFDDIAALNVNSINWQNRSAHVRSDRLIWIGAATLDIGITYMPQNLQFNHLVDADTDAERDFLATQLEQSGTVIKRQTVKLAKPYRLLNIHALRGHKNSSARMKVYEITAQTTDLSPDSSKKQ